MKITVNTTVSASIDAVWRAYTSPDDIKQWNAASPDWHTTAAAVDLREGGAFSSRMEAKDGSMGFDFAGTYTRIHRHFTRTTACKSDHVPTFMSVLYVPW